MTPARRYDAIIVGAGISGLYLLHRLRALGLSVLVLDQAGGVGGTWFWNRYPGARCDIESMTYSYSWSHELEQEWTWSERYAGQAEILAYLEHVADRFDLRRDIQLGTRVVEASWDDEDGSWSIAADDGERRSARFLIMATGCLSRRHAYPTSRASRASPASCTTPGSGRTRASRSPASAWP